jgi:hypothetical protein
LGQSLIDWEDGSVDRRDGGRNHPEFINTAVNQRYQFPDFVLHSTGNPVAEKVDPNADLTGPGF